MKNLGLRGDRFTIKYGVISRHFGKDGSHDLTEDEWEQLPQALQAPFAISRLSNKKDGYRLYTTLKNSSGEYIVVGADVKNGGRDIEVNAISTVFGRRQNANLTENEEVIYRSKNITPEQSALLDRPNSDQYPTEGELSSDGKDKKTSDTKQGKEKKSSGKSDEVANRSVSLPKEKLEEIRERASRFATETEAESGAFDRLVPKMSDEELLAYMRLDGNGDMNEAYHPELYDEYDSRHSDEELEGYDSYLQQLRDSGTTTEQAEDMLAKVQGDFKTYGATAERSMLSAQQDALIDYISELSSQERLEHGSNEAAGSAVNSGTADARTHERTSPQLGARPAQGTATTTDDGLVRTHERTSLQSGEKGDVNAGENVSEPGAHDQLAEERAEIEHRAKEDGEAQNVGYSSDEEDEDVLYRDSDEDNDNMRSVSSDNDDKLRVTTLPLNMRIPVSSYSGEATTLQAANAIQNLGPTVFTLDGYELSVSRKTKKKLSNQLSQNANKGYYKIALEHLPEIIGNSVLVEEHRDRTKVNGERTPESPSDQNIDRTQRFYGAVNINGKSYRVKTTAVVLKQGNNRMHSYEVTKMELLISTPTENSQEAASSSNSITLANLLQNVEFSYEKGRKILDEMQNNADVSDNDILYRVEDDPEELKKLEMEPKVKVYRAMQLIDGKLYPPMAAKVNGSLVEPAEPGQWLRADEHPELAKNGLFTLNKGGKDASGKRLGSVPAAYNPYWHTSRSPLNDQFSSAYKRPNLVTVEVEVPESELTSGYRAERAKDATGEVEWKSGPVGREMAAQGKPRMVILSRWDKPVRIVPVEEVADEYAKRLQGTGISVPFNTVPPALREALVARGVEISEPEKGNAGVASRPSYEEWLRGERREREGDGAYTDDELSELNDPFVKILGEKSRTAKQRKAFAARERRNMTDAVRELAERLHLDNVEIVTEPMEVKDRRGKVHHPKGFFNTKTGKITVVIPNHANVDDAVQTLLHEAVAHYGLRQLFGEHFDTFLRNVYEAADMDVRRRITELALRKYGGDFRVATEEYLASLAEKTDFENMPHGFWQKIKRMFLAMLHAIGFDGFADKGVTLSDNELRYILWRSYENLKEPGEHRSILGEAEDVAKQAELKVGNYGEMAAQLRPTERSLNGQQKVAESDGVAENAYRPSGKGYFGNIYTQFKGKVMEGINFLSRVRGGVLQGVWHRKGIGDIDLVWGDDGGGLCHILKKHINDKDFKNKADFVNRLNDIVNNGNVEFENGDKVVLKKDGYVVTIRKNIRERGKKIADENWVLTAYNKDAPATTTAPADGTHGSTAVAPGASSAAKLGNNVGNAVNKGENVSELEVGARPAQGTATTTGAGSIQAGEDNSADRLRTHERTSLQSGEPLLLHQLPAEVSLQDTCIEH